MITLGGDGTILHVSNLFGEGECPPVLSFSMGSLGFLLPFRKSPPCQSSHTDLPMSLSLTQIIVDIDSLGQTLDATLDGPVSLLNRMRLACMPLTLDGKPLECTKAGELGTYETWDEHGLTRQSVMPVGKS